MDAMKPLYTQRLVKPRDVLIQELEGESVLLHVRKGRYFGLNGMGHAMWTTLTASQSVQEAFDRLATEYPVEPDQLKADLDALIDELLSHELLEIVAE